VNALTITQPWATLIAVGVKRIETRSWYSHHRGPLAIHAAKGFTAEDKEACYIPQFRAALAPFVNIHQPIESQLPFASVIATCTLLSVIPVSKLAWDPDGNDVKCSVWPPGFEIADANNERTFGNYEDGRFAWLLGNIKRIDPIEARGAQGLWKWHGFANAKPTEDAKNAGGKR
jgi:hypothetical protein